MFIRHISFVAVLMGMSLVMYCQEAKLILPVGHIRAINHVAVSPDESIVATASSDRSVKIWEKATGKLLYNLDQFPSWVWFATFSPDGKKLLTSSGDSVLRVWNTENFELAYELPKFRRDVSTANFSPDGRFFMAAYESEELSFFDVNSGKKVKEISSQGNKFEKAIFSPDSKKVIITFRGKPEIMIYEWSSGKLLNTLKGHTDDIRDIRTGSNGKFLASTSLDSAVNIWDIQTGALIHSYKSNSVIHGIAISPDCKQVCFVTLDGVFYLMDTGNGSVKQFTAPVKRITMTSIVYSPDSKQVYISSNSSNEIYKLDAETGKSGIFFRGHTEPINNITLTGNGKMLLSSSSDKTATLWDTETGKMLVKFQGRNDEKFDPVFSNNGGYFLVHSTTAKFNGLRALDVWNTGSGKKIFSLHGGRNGFSKPVFSSDEQFMSVITLKDTVLNVFSLSSGKLINTFKYTLDIQDDFFTASGDEIILLYQTGRFMTWNFITNEFRELKTKPVLEDPVIPDAFISPGGKWRIVKHSRTCELWSVQGNQKIFSWDAVGNNNINKAEFSNDGSMVFISDYGNTIRVADVATGKVSRVLPGFTYAEAPAVKMLAVINKMTIDFYHSKTFDLLYKVVSLDSNDYLVLDSANRYDGSEAARKLLYFTCGSEVVELEQVKDQLWVPGLAERIMKGETINSKSLQELNVCGLMPVIRESGNNEEYRFNIKPGRGGLGETVIYVNNIEIRRYIATGLEKNGDDYVLTVKRKDLAEYFSSGSDNQVSVKSFTADNDLSSRGVIGTNTEAPTKKNIIPNLHAVLVGVSDYKGDEMDLKYAAKDASDISRVIKHAAGKLLNTDGKEHVYLYNLNTGSDRDQLPEKNSIRKVLEEIGKKATPDDILLIFFAGHGVMSETEKQFYFLTVEASSLTAGSSLKDIGISTSELTEWIKLDNIKAQKRILIFDACNSGQAIKDFVKMGNEGQGYMAARNDEKARQIKAIDKLNERAGLFILAASASNQNAYEMGRYSQGLLTYSLLKAIKEQPDILQDGKYLDVSRWFNAAEKTVSELTKDNADRQQPQIVSNTNFNIGLVDDDVKEKIVLPLAKPLFSNSNLQNRDEAISIDDLGLNKLVDEKLSYLSYLGAESKISFIPAARATDAYRVSGRYEIKGDTIIARIILHRGVVIKHRFEVRNITTNTEALAEEIAKKIVEFIK